MSNLINALIYTWTHGHKKRERAKRKVFGAQVRSVKKGCVPFVAFDQRFS